MNALVYTRISQDRVGLAAGVTRQREDCDRRCTERGWSIVAHHSDNDISAAGKRKRPGFDAMLAAIESGKVGAVVAWSLDRLQRNRRDELRLYEACRGKDVVISLVNGAELDFGSATGRLVADNLGSLARFEIELKSDRQKAATEQAAKAGKRVGGRRPFGYDQDGMTVRDDEVRAVRDGYAAVLAGVSLGEIARDWNRRGHTTAQVGYKSGKPGAWRRDNVRAVLVNARNVGKRVHNGETVAEAVWPGIVDESTYLAARAVLDHPDRRRAPLSGRNLLSGIALCGVCGAQVHGGGGVRRGVRNYRCKASTGHLGRMAEPVEDYVESLMVARLSQRDAVELLVDQDKPDLEQLRSEAVTLRSRLDGAASEYADGSITAGQLRTITGRVRARLAAVEAEMADAGKVDVLGPIVTAADVAAVWDGLSTERKRAVLDLLATITLLPPGRGTRTFRPESVRIDWRTP